LTNPASRERDSTFNDERCLLTCLRFITPKGLDSTAQGREALRAHPGLDDAKEAFDPERVG